MDKFSTFRETPFACSSSFSPHRKQRNDRCADRIAVGKIASRHANVMTFPIRVVDNIFVEGRCGLARASMEKCVATEIAWVSRERASERGRNNARVPEISSFPCCAMRGALDQIPAR